MEEPAIGVQTLVTDGDSHLQLGMHGVMKRSGIKVDEGDCTRHITHSKSRNIRRASLSDGCTEGPNKSVYQRAQNKARFAHFIERR